MDSRLVGRYRNATINVVKPTRNELERERNTVYGSREVRLLFFELFADSQVVMELNANGTFLLTLYEFDSPHLVSTTKMRGMTSSPMRFSADREGRGVALAGGSSSTALFATMGSRVVIRYSQRVSLFCSRLDRCLGASPARLSSAPLLAGYLL